MRKRTAKTAETVSAQNKTYYVSDKWGNFFCGYKRGNLYWSDRISEARELTEPQHFTSIKRWEKDREPKQEFL